MIGMGFGTSYSIAYVNPFDWVHTKFYKRVIRGVVGTLLVWVIGFIFQKFVLVYDQSTIYIVQRALPALLFSLFIYGCFPIICQKVGLVDPEVLEVPEAPQILEVENNQHPDEETQKKKPQRLLGDD